MGKKFLSSILLIILGLLLFLNGQQTIAADLGDMPVICIIIDDIGYRHKIDREAMTLPGPVAYAIMPHSPHAVAMAKMANQRGKDVILHLPMEPVRNEKDHKDRSRKQDSDC